MLTERRDAGLAPSLQRADKEIFMSRGRQENLSTLIWLRVPSYIMRSIVRPRTERIKSCYKIRQLLDFKVVYLNASRIQGFLFVCFKGALHSFGEKDFNQERKLVLCLNKVNKQSLCFHD